MTIYDTPYKELHRRASNNLGRAEVCSTCFRTFEETRIEWANLSGEYKKDLEDYLPLCRSCHMVFDNISEKVWQTRRKRYGKTGHKKTANWKGWKHSAESRKKMSNTRKGRTFSSNHKENLSKSIKKHWNRRIQND